MIPFVGRVAAESTSLLLSVGRPLGLSDQQVAVFILVAAIAAYFLDESEATGEKRTDRSTGRATGFSGLLLVGGAVALVLATATMSMTAATGAIALPYDSVAPAEAGQGGIPAGTTANASVELQNGGLVPMTAVLSTSNPNVELAQERVSLSPRGNASVNVSITAPSEPGSYEVTVERKQYLAILPVGVLGELSAVSHWLAVAAVDLLLALGVAAIGAKLVGGGRLRLRPTRSLPVEVGTARWVRSFYRDR
ncbi:hypothetical protein ACFQML_09060 [Salinirubellus salinus]|uniref:hypothetical protein n=1 Tax=Salinirubellus salinus TaxID=1364945 RepID=UPI00360FDEC6